MSLNLALRSAEAVLVPPVDIAIPFPSRTGAEEVVISPQTAYLDRIKFTGELEEISQVVCDDFGLGEPIANNPIFVGYEDFNFVLETTKGKYFVKVFASSMSDARCQRTVDVTTEVLKAGVRTPKLYKSDKGTDKGKFLRKLEVSDCILRLCVMEYIDGKDIYSSGDSLSPEEIRTIAQQAALINSIDLHPSPIYVTNAVVNFLKEFESLNGYLSEEDSELVKPLVTEFEKLEIDELPRCFVHGDFTGTNAMKDGMKTFWTIDFGDAGRGVRIQELAVLAGDILYDPECREKSNANFNIALEAYQETIELTDRELEALPTFSKVSIALFLIRRAYHAGGKKNTPRENGDRYQRARARLEQMLEKDIPNLL